MSLPCRGTDAAAKAERAGAYLDKLHIYTLAHVLRRPLVVYAAKSDLGLDSIDGLYLPDLWATASRVRGFIVASRI